MDMIHNNFCVVLQPNTKHNFLDLDNEINANIPNFCSPAYIVWYYGGL